jgi:hypothetical protein
MLEMNLFHLIVFQPVSMLFHTEFTAAYEWFSHQRFLDDWISSALGLGECYSRPLQGQTTAQNFLRALKYLGEALKEATLNSHRWAQAHLLIGELLLNNDKTQLFQSLSHFEAASDIFTRAASPELWLRMQLNLGLCHTQIAVQAKTLKLDAMATITHTQKAREALRRVIGVLDDKPDATISAKVEQAIRTLEGRA